MNLDWIKHILQNLNKPLIWFPLWLFSLLLWLCLKYLKSELTIMKNYQDYVFVFMLFSFCSWFIALYPGVKNLLIKIRKERKLLETIRTLNESEKFILTYCFLKKERHIYLKGDVGTTFNDLKSSNLVVRTHIRGRGFPYDTYTIPDWFFKFITRSNLRSKLYKLLNTTEISDEMVFWGIRNIDDFEFVQNEMKAKYKL